MPLFPEISAMGKTWKEDKHDSFFLKNKESKFSKGSKKEFKPSKKRKRGHRLLLRNLPLKVRYVG